MGQSREHPCIETLKRDLAEARIDRREYLRMATLLGLEAGLAYAFVAKVTGRPAAAADTSPKPKGGTLRLAMAVQSIESPHTYEWAGQHNFARQVVEYLTKTGHDNVTRPYLLEGWEASDDLKTWTLKVRRGVKWHNGRDFTADDVLWNFRRVLDPKVGSSMLGLVKGYLLESYEKEGRTETRLWDASAIEKIDAHTIRLNCKVPQLAVPEHLFHYPFMILDPEENGVFAPGSNGTGAFELVSHELGKRSELKARADYWGEGPYIDRLVFIDTGDDPAGTIDALASRRVDGAHSIDLIQLDAVKLMGHLKLYTVPTADTSVVRGKVTRKPFDDARVRKAMRLAVDAERTRQIILGDLGLSAEHHHVCPIHPEYARLPAMARDVAAAKRLLAEAGYGDGIDLGTIDCKSAPSWEFSAVQAMVEQWKEAGIRCRINLMSSAEFWKIWDKTTLGFTEWA
ncbi:MAG: ABC transporter substrate-binding protein, partial [Alphaproteobacteria bacterium]|nr:ABC transporter substrate-binding protein [Alphaproteobacteria bacterium]